MLGRPWRSRERSESRHTRRVRSLLRPVHVASPVSPDVDSREEVASRGSSAGLGRWIAADEGAARKEGTLLQAKKAPLLQNRRNTRQSSEARSSTVKRRVGRQWRAGGHAAVVGRTAWPLALEHHA